MAGTAEWKAKIELDINSLKSQISEAENLLNNLEKKDRKVEINVNTKTLESAVKKLDKMLDSIGKGTGNFKQFENLYKELSSIATEVQSLSRAFGKIDDSGTKTLLSSIQNIDKSLSELSQNILNVNKNMSNIGSNASEASKQIENIGNAATNAIDGLEKATQSEQKFQKEAKETKKVIDSITFTPNTEGFDEVISKFGILKKEAQEIAKITKQSVKNKDGSFDTSYKVTKKNGTSYNLGENSNPQVLTANETVYNAKVNDAIKETISKYKELQEVADNLHLSVDYSNLTNTIETLNSKLKEGKVELSDYNKQIKNAFKDFNTNVSTKENDISKAQKLSNNLNSMYENRLQNSNTYTVSDTYEKKIQELKQAKEKLDASIKKFSESSNHSMADNEDLSTAYRDAEKAASAIKNLSAAQKGMNSIGAQKAIKKINELLEMNPKYSDEAKNSLKELKKELESGFSTKSIQQVNNEMLKLHNNEVDAGRSGKGLTDVIKEKQWYGLASQIAGIVSLYDVINAGKEAASIVTDLNSQIVDLAKVSEDSTKQIYDDFDSYADIAKNIGGTISDTIKATTAWAKNGYNIPDSKELARVSQLYKNVGDDIDIDSANESLISTLKGFKLEADQAEHIVDIFNEVSNNESISSSGIGAALQRSAASFNAANTSLEKSVALITATNSVVQDPEKVGKQIIAYLYSNVMKIKVAISVKLLRRTRPRKDYNICFNY